MKVAFIGYRATGKSTVAKILSERLNLPLADSDALIEERAGKTIAEIFRDEGEPSFRDLEAQIIAELLEAPGSFVLSTGGGAPVRDETRRALKERAVVFWLTCSPEGVVQRMLGDAGTESRRPALTRAATLLDEVKSVLHAREPLYRDAATFAINTEGRQPAAIVDEIVGHLSPDATS